MKLLIVDDSMIMRRAIEDFAQGIGLEIVGEADNGVRALELFKEHRPDIVTLDITMPQMDGLTCLKEIISLDAEARVIVITALSKKNIAIEALKAGAKRFLHKPFSEQELVQVLKEVMG